MTDKAFLCSVDNIMGTGNGEELNIQFNVCFTRDNGDHHKILMETFINVSDTLAEMRDKLAAAIRAKGDELGYDVNPNNRVIMLSFQKV